MIGRERFQQEVGPVIQRLRRAEKLDKIAKPLKTIGKIGTAAQVASTGLVLAKNYSATQQAVKEADDARTLILRNYGVQVKEILLLYRQKKIGQVQRNRLLLQARHTMEDLLLAAGFTEEIGIFLNGTVALKNGLGTFVPIPLEWIGLAPEENFKGKPFFNLDLGSGIVDPR